LNYRLWAEIVLTLVSREQVQETGWVYPQQSPSPVEDIGELVEAEAACESTVRSHCSDGEASLDTSTHPPQVKLRFAADSFTHEA
jgi:hypothetical protein